MPKATIGKPPAGLVFGGYPWLMEWLVFLLSGGGVALAGRYAWDRRAARRREAAELELMRELADHDVTLLGEELGRLDEAIAGHQLDHAALEDYQSALDSYESARRTVARLAAADEVSGVADVLTGGRYAVACVRARVAGQPLPERRAPCFFNPQHGPSAVDVEWTPPVGGTRRVPACAQDAARVKAGDELEGRYTEYAVPRDPYRRDPRWEAGALIEPYSLGYFASSGARAAMMGLSMEMRGEGGGRWGAEWEAVRVRRGRGRRQ